MKILEKISDAVIVLMSGQELLDIEHPKFVMPQPCKNDGKLNITVHNPRHFYKKVQEELFEVMEEIFKVRAGFSDKDKVAEEIADLITVCISYLEANGYDIEKRSEIFRKVNTKNLERGYMKEL